MTVVWFHAMSRSGGYMRTVNHVLLGLFGAAAATACGDDSTVAPARVQDGGSDRSTGASPGAGGQGGVGRDSAGGTAGMDAGDIDGSSVGCASDQECPAGQKCDTASRRCVPRTSCMSTADCSSMGKRTLCDTATGDCVECMATTDCPKDNDCIRSACVPYTSCVNTRECPNGLVCNTTRGRCVECVTDAECGDDRRCGGNVCRRACASDLTCRPLGLLCDMASGYCVQCVAHADCAAAEHCVAGGCQTDVCVQGSAKCENNAIVACDSVGSKLESPQPCSSPQVCAESGGMATCRTRICTPSAVFCGEGGNKIVECSADGFTQTVKQDCASTSQACVARACQTVLFAENFEDGDFNGWISGSGNYLREVSTATAADGTLRSLLLDKIVGGAGPPDGVYRTFTSPLQPITVSFWINPGITQRTEFYSSDTVNNFTRLVSFLSSFSGMQLEASEYINTSFAANAWHHIELRNINWNARTFDYWIDGAEQGTGIAFVNSGTSIARMDLFGYVGQIPEVTGYWDEIVFR